MSYQKTDLLTPKEAADYLNVSTKFLEARRSRKLTPLYLKFGRLIRYHRWDLDTFLEESTVGHRKGPIGLGFSLD